jgi:antitoxin component YwqK of YwqJK toxin-antitoxin module
MSSSNPYIQHENYQPYPLNRKRRFFGKKMMLFLVFFLLIGVILFTTVFKDVSFKGISFGDITGRVVFWGGDTSNYVGVSMELIPPELNLNGNHQKIIIKGTSNSPLIVGRHQYFLKEAGPSEIILGDFSGKISINKESITPLEGSVSKITINGVLISDIKGKNIKISIDSPIYYDSIEFKDEIHLKKLEYITMGTLTWGEKNYIKLENEKIDIRNFIGIINFRENQMHLKGIVENVIGKDFRVK